MTKQQILAINGGSSTIKFALFEKTESLHKIAEGKLEGRSVDALLEWVQANCEKERLAVVGHRLVQGGPNYYEPTRITSEMIEELRSMRPFDPEHLPQELELIETIYRYFPKVAQVACFDTAFHHEMPTVAKLLAIPRRYQALGVRRYGFHGLSYQYLMLELTRLAGAEAAGGKVILAHLGSGASLAAVSGGKPIDTSMGFTPASGIPMGTRTGDLDPGLVSYLMGIGGLKAIQFNQMVNSESGLLGISEISSDMRELLALEGEDPRAAEAVSLFCYQAKKWVGGFAASLGGLDTLVFSGGIGENAPVVRSRICHGLGFLGIEIDEKENSANREVISRKSSRVAVRVIPTDEEWMIAKNVSEGLYAFD